jgi:hypothetical protein
MSSTTGERREEESMEGASFIQISVKSVIKALSSRRFQTPNSSALKIIVDDRNGAEKSDRDRFADELASAMDDVEESAKSLNEIPLPGSDGLSEVVPVFPDRVIGEDFHKCIPG